MRAIPIPLLLVLLLLLSPASTSGAEDATAARIPIWRLNLGAEDALAAAIESLMAALESGDARAVTDQCQPAPLLLQLLDRPMPATLTGHSQARVLLENYFRVRGPVSLRIGQARLEAEGRRAQVAIDIIGGLPVAGRSSRHRFVAAYTRSDSGWQLAELRCP